MPNVDPNLIRAYVDGELPPDAARRIRDQIQTDPAALAQVEFESRLKRGVNEAMSSAPAAPPALAAGIRAALDAQVAAETAAQQSREPEPSTDRARQTSPGWTAVVAAFIARLSRPRPISTGAVLGVVAIVGVVVLISIFAPQIDTIAPSQRTETVADPAEYASQEHDRCVKNPEHLLEKINFCSPHEAALALREHFGIEGVTVFDLTSLGYKFLGESRCGVPGAKQSAHLLYQRSVAGESQAKLSIFIAEGPSCRKTGCGRELRPGEWQRSRGSECRKRVLQSTDSSLVYYLVACDGVDAAPIAELVSETLLAKAR